MIAVVDPMTGTRINLRAFGADNALAFAALMPPAGTAGTTAALAPAAAAGEVR